MDATGRGLRKRRSCKHMAGPRRDPCGAEAALLAVLRDAGWPKLPLSIGMVLQSFGEMHPLEHLGPPHSWFKENFEV